MRLSFVDGGKAPRAFTASTKGFYSGCVLKMARRLFIATGAHRGRDKISAGRRV